MNKNSKPKRKNLVMKTHLSDSRDLGNAKTPRDGDSAIPIDHCISILI